MGVGGGVAIGINVENIGMAFGHEKRGRSFFCR